MQLVDGCVFSYPQGTVSISRYARELNDMGYSGFVVSGTEPEQILSYPSVWSARYLSGIPARLLAREAGRPASTRELVFVSAGDAGFNRSALTTPGVHVLVDIQNSPRDGFDRHCAHLAAERQVGVGLSVRPLIELRDVARQKVIRKYEEIFTLQNRYEFPLVLSSHASDITHLKSPREMIRLFSVVWDDEELLLSALSTIPGIKTRPGSVCEV